MKNLRVGLVVSLFSAICGLYFARNELLIFLLPGNNVDSLHGSKELRSEPYLSHDKIFGPVNASPLPVRSTDLSKVKRDILCHGIHRFFSATQISDDERMLYYHELGFDLLTLFAPHLVEPISKVNTSGSLTCRRDNLDAHGHLEGGIETLLFCGVVKNQAYLMDRFLSYHWVQGGKHFVIYDDDSTDNLMDVLQPWINSDIVTYRRSVSVDQNSMQFSSYKDCFDRYGTRYDWVAFLDFDEFLIPLQKDTCLLEILSDYKSFGALAINWALFEQPSRIFINTSFQLEDRNYGAGSQSSLVKVICRVANTEGPAYNMPHACVYKDNFFAVDENKKPLSKPWSRNMSTPARRIQINHYRSGSIEELAKKLARDIHRSWLSNNFASIQERCDLFFSSSRSGDEHRLKYPNAPFIQKLVYQAKYTMNQLSELV